MVDEPALAAAVGAAAAQLGMERVERLWRQLPDLHLPQER
jgi:hypothetical protein